MPRTQTWCAARKFGGPMAFRKLSGTFDSPEVTENYLTLSWQVICAVRRAQMVMQSRVQRTLTSYCERDHCMRQDRLACLSLWVEDKAETFEAEWYICCFVCVCACVIPSPPSSPCHTTRKQIRWVSHSVRLDQMLQLQVMRSIMIKLLLNISFACRSSQKAL